MSGTARLVYSVGFLIARNEGGRLSMIGNSECICPNHIFHICALKDCGLNDKNSDTFCGLHRNPEYKCERCGETSENAENLCFPQKISKDKDKD